MRLSLCLVTDAATQALVMTATVPMITPRCSVSIAIG